ncbi:hypothetical protein PCCS19_23090 [Paenibacillus sp. CCS19]|nr:hypothetical protein PCCS19_23090 [Paenibacillus cellulosilyticus]
MQIIIRVILIALLTFFLRYNIDNDINLLDLIAPIVLILGIINERKNYKMRKRKK